MGGGHVACERGIINTCRILEEYSSEWERRVCSVISRRDYNMEIDLKERAFEVMGSFQLAYNRY